MLSFITISTSFRQLLQLPSSRRIIPESRSYRLKFKSVNLRTKIYGECFKSSDGQTDVAPSVGNSPSIKRGVNDVI